MTTQYGAPLTGEQMKLLRAAGLPEGTEVQILYSCMVGKEWCDSTAANVHALSTARLPADHPAYTLLNAGWLDGRNVALWFGGEKAPDDWDEDSEVLWDNRGQGTKTHGVKDPSHPWSHNNDAWYDIIAYTRKAEGMTTHADRVLADAERAAKRMGGELGQNELWGDVVAASGEAAKADACAGCHGLNTSCPDGCFDEQHKTVTITLSKMTEAEANEWLQKRHCAAGGMNLLLLDKLGLIKPEPTRLERFWATRDTKDVYGPPCKAFQLIEEALEFERD